MAVLRASSASSEPSPANRIFVGKMLTATPSVSFGFPSPFSDRYSLFPMYSTKSAVRLENPPLVVVPAQHRRSPKAAGAAAPCSEMLRVLWRKKKKKVGAVEPSAHFFATARLLWPVRASA